MSFSALLFRIWRVFEAYLFAGAQQLGSEPARAQPSLLTSGLAALLVTQQSLVVSVMHLYQSFSM